MKKSDPDSAESQLYAAQYEAETLRNENAALRRKLESLTPGGSEFQSPDACVEWIRRRLRNTGTIAAERNALRRQVAQVPIDDIQKMQGCEAHTEATERAKINVAYWLQAWHKKWPKSQPDKWEMSDEMKEAYGLPVGDE